MNDLKQAYEAISDIWRLRKQYGSGPLRDEQWDRLIEQGQALHKKHAENDLDADIFFREMFAALKNFYVRKGMEHT